MFYSKEVLAKKAPLAKIWIAAHWERRITKESVIRLDIQDSVDDVLNGVPIALRTSGHLLLGIVRIYSRKVRYLYTDCNDALVKIKMAYHPGNVDLPQDQVVARINDITMADNMDFADVVIPEFNFDDIPEIAAFDPILPSQLAIQGNNLSRKEDITMDNVEGDMEHEDNLMSQAMEVPVVETEGGNNEEWLVFNPEALEEDIEVEQPRGIEVESRDIENPLENVMNDDITMKQAAMDDNDRPLVYDDEPIPQYDDDEPRLSLADSMNLDMPSPALSKVAPDTPAMTPGKNDADEDFGLNFQTPEIRVKKAKRRRGDAGVLIDENTRINSEQIKIQLNDYAPLLKDNVDSVEVTALAVEKRFYGSDLALKRGRPSWNHGKAAKNFLETRFASAPMKKHKFTLVDADVEDEEVGEENPEMARGVTFDENTQIQEDDYRPLEYDEPIPRYDDEDLGAGAGLDDTHGTVTLPEEQEVTETGNLSFMTAAGEDAEQVDEQEQEEREEEKKADGETDNHCGWTYRSRRMLHHLQGEMSDGKETLNFNHMVAKNRRRTVAQCFFELLVLKNKDYIQVEQAEPYGDINVLRGRRFETDPKIVVA